MRRLLSVAMLAVVFVSVACAWCGADGKKVKTEVRTTGKFTRIVLDSPVSVHYTQGNKVSVTVKGPADELKDVQTKVSSGTLYISYKTRSRTILRGLTFFGSNKTDGVEVFVTSPDLLGVKLVGPGDFDCRGRLDTDNLKIELCGSGDIFFSNIICDNIVTELVGSGDIVLKNVDALKSVVSLVGSGDINISQKNVKTTNITLKGSGDIGMKFSKCGVADCSLRGSGDIRLSGTLGRLSKKSLGSGDFHTGGLRTGN